MTVPTLEPEPRERRGSPAVAIGNEVVKGLLHGWAERWQIVFETAMFAAMLLLFAALLGQGDAILEGRFVWRLDPQRTSWLLVGFGAFTFHYLQTQKPFWVCSARSRPAPSNRSISARCRPGSWPPPRSSGWSPPRLGTRCSSVG